MARMIAKSYKIVKCPYGCCDAYRVKPRSRQTGKQMVKAIEEREWRKEFEESQK